MQLTARIRAICIVFALLMVPGMVHATDYYLVGDFNKWTASDTYKFNVSGTTATLSLTGAQINDASTQFLIKAVESSSKSWFLKNSSTSVTSVTVGGDAVTASSYYNETGGNYSVSGLSTASTTTYTFTLTADGTDINSSKLKITSATTGVGGGTTTTVNQPGIYLYGQNFGSTDPNKHLTYKFLRKNDSEYHFALYAGSMKFSVEKYEHDRGKLDITPSWNNWQFKIAYIDADGNVSTFCPPSNYTLTNTDGTASTSKEFGNNTQWTIQDNGGMYDLVVKVDANGKPTSWYYESDPNRIVSYKASSTSNWTTEGFLYCLKNPNTEATSYCKNFFGTVPMVKDEEFKFITGNYWLGLRYDQEPYGTNVAISGDQDAPNLKNPYDGIYPIEYNLDRTNYQLAGDAKTPLRIFMIGSALNNNLSNTFTDWDPADAVELVYDSEEQCYKGTVSLAKKGEFRFLRDTNTSGSATSLKLNFGEDSNKPGNGGDTDANNHVAYNDDSSKGTNVVFNPETNTYNVRFYIEAGTGMSNFNWNSAKYRYTIELPTRLSTTITPPTATVAYGASLTPRVAVVGTTNATRTYAYTLNGTVPVINTATGKAGNDDTKVVTYTYDAVIPTNDLGTFYMAPGNVLTFIDNEGKTSTLTGNTVTVKAQAVQTVTEGSKYRLEGNIATGNYTFEEAGVQLGSNYTLTISNENTGSTPSVNKAIADVTVTNSTTNDDDGVDVYYTTDNSNPLESTTARLVRDRKVTVYALPGEVGNAGTIKVAIPGTTASASCTYDITYSTSEGGYQNYLSNSASTDKTLGGDGHVVVYVQPYTSDKTYTTSARQTYVYAYEKKSDGTYASLTPVHRVLADADKTTVNGETWYALDLVPVSGYKEVNVQMGYYNTSDKTYKTSDATVANAYQDMFLKFDVATGQITDVTHAYTGDHFYTTGTNGTKTEAANPESGKPFFYAQVPLTWTSNGNSVKVLSGDTELSGATVKVQNGAETSDLSSVCKVYVPTSLVEKTELTIKPYKGTTASKVSFTITYQNGGYYFYESASHYSTKAPLVFSPDTDNKKDHRSYGRKDINHVTTGDKTHYLANSWTYSPETESKTASITDNWNGAKSATVNVIPTGTTISQTVTGLSPDSTYTVQMIVRGKSGAKGTMTLEGAKTTTDELNLTGYNAQGVITADGRVEYLLNNDANKNGWQKLEASVKPATDGTVTVKLTANGNELQLSDVTLLENANTKGHVWTTAPTSNETTEYDLSDRKMANAFSFFDRGDNKNAIIYANANTVLGMSENTYDVAVAIPASSPAKAIHRASDSAQDGRTPEYSMHRLALTDAGTAADNQRTSSYTFNITKDNVTTESFSYDRKYSAGIMSSFCLPVALTKDQLSSMGVSTIYEYTGLKVETGKDTEVQFTEHNVSGSDEFTTKAGMPYIVKFSSAGSFAADAEMAVAKGNAGTSSDGVFIGSYAFQTLRNSDASNPTLFFYSGSANSLGKFTPAFADELGTNMKAFRGYFDFSKYASPAKKYVFVLVKGFDQPTGISDINTDVDDSKAPIYNLSGQLVRKDGNRNMLPKGLYIQDNHKFIIK